MSGTQQTTLEESTMEEEEEQEEEEEEEEEESGSCTRTHRRLTERRGVSGPEPSRRPSRKPPSS
jgi:hypothetical protein